jgi:outer membrane immunogenic protein
MKSTLISSLAAVATFAASPAAMAADLSGLGYFLHPPQFFRDWSGFYIGGNIGAGWATGTLTDSVTGASFAQNNSGFVGGATFGANWEIIPRYVLGLEGALDGASIAKTSNTVGVTINGVANTVQGSSKTNWLSTVAARFGIAQNNILFYGKAGGGWGYTTASLNNLSTGGSAGASNTVGGWLLGAGIEYPLTYNWTVKVEYDFLGLTNWTAASPLVPGDTFTVARQVSMFTVGANYRF